MGTMAEAVIGGVIVILFTILMDRVAGTAGLTYALVASVALYVLVLSRNSSAQPWWGTVTTVSVLLLSVSVGFGAWNLFVSPALRTNRPKTANPQPPTSVPEHTVRVKYSSVQAVDYMTPDVPGFASRRSTIALDAVATMHLLFGDRSSARLVLPKNIPVTVEKPRSDVTYPGGLQFPSAGQGIEIAGAASFSGPQQHYEFTREKRTVRIEISGRTFIVSLNDIRDRSPSNGTFIEYSFGITEQ